MGLILEALYRMEENMSEYDPQHLESLKKSHPEQYHRIMESLERDREDTFAFAWRVHMSSEEQDQKGRRMYELSREKCDEPEGDGWLKTDWR